MGSLINVVNDLTVVAGNEVNIRQSELNSQDGNIAIHGDQGVNIVEGRETRDLDVGATYSSKKLLSKKSGEYTASINSDDGVGSIVSGKNVQITSDQDVLIRGSDVVADENTVINAKNDLMIEASQDSYSEVVATKNKKSGLMISGGIGFTIGSVKETLDRSNQELTHSGSMVGSLKGNTVLQAGNSYTQQGSTVA